MRGATKIQSNITNRAVKLTLTAQGKIALQTHQLHSSKYTKNDHGIQNSKLRVERERKKKKGSFICWILLDVTAK